MYRFNCVFLYKIFTLACIANIINFHFGGGESRIKYGPLQFGMFWRCNKNGRL